MTRLRIVLALVLVPYLALAGGVTSPSGGGGGGTSTPNFSNIVDDLPCGVLQLPRRNAADTAWECIAAPGGGDAFTSASIAQFIPIDSATLKGEISDETGSGGVIVYSTSPSLTTPALGTPTALVGTNISGTANNLTAGHAGNFDNMAGALTCIGLTCIFSAASVPGSAISVPLQAQGDHITYDAGASAWVRDPIGTSHQLARVNAAGTLHEYFTNVETECFPVYAPNSGITANDDITSVWRAPDSVTINEVFCETDTGTVSMDLRIDDGSPALVMGADLVCDTTGVADNISLSGAMIAGNRLDFAIASIGGSPRRLTVCINYTR